MGISKRGRDRKKNCTTTWSYLKIGIHIKLYNCKKSLRSKEVDEEMSTLQILLDRPSSLCITHVFMFLKFDLQGVTGCRNRNKKRFHNRDQAKNLVKMYDGQFPEENLELYLDYYEMTKEEFQDVINFWANKDILKFEKGKWIPKFEIV